MIKRRERIRNHCEKTPKSSINYSYLYVLKVSRPRGRQTDLLTC